MAKKITKASAPAPAPKAVKKVAVKKVAAQKAAAPAKVAPAPVPTPVKKVAVKKVATKKIAAKKAAAPKAPPAKITTIIAKVDVGFGNSLYLRGDSAGLAWEKGVLMGCAGADEWVWSTDSVVGTLEFKVLLNDEIWASGENAFIAAGDRVVLEPTF